MQYPISCMVSNHLKGSAILETKKQYLLSIEDILIVVHLIVVYSFHGLTLRKLNKQARSFLSGNC